MGIYKEKHLDIFVKAGYITENEKKKLWRVVLMGLSKDFSILEIRSSIKMKEWQQIGVFDNVTIQQLPLCFTIANERRISVCWKMCLQEFFPANLLQKVERYIALQRPRGR